MQANERVMAAGPSIPAPRRGSNALIDGLPGRKTSSVPVLQDKLAVCQKNFEAVFATLQLREAELQELRAISEGPITPTAEAAPQPDTACVDPILTAEPPPPPLPPQSEAPAKGAPDPKLAAALRAADIARLAAEAAERARAAAVRESEAAAAETERIRTATHREMQQMREDHSMVCAQLAVVRKELVAAQDALAERVAMAAATSPPAPPLPTEAPSEQSERERQLEGQLASAREEAARREEEHATAMETLRQEHAVELRAKGASMRALWAQQVEALREKEVEHAAALAAVRAEVASALCGRERESRPRAKTVGTLEQLEAVRAVAATSH